MVRAVEKWAEGFDITRTVRIQGHLLEEDIEWGNSTSDEKDRALCVALSLYAARARAQKELREMIVLTAAQRVTADSIQTFIDLAPDEIAKWRKKAEGITDAHVKRLYLRH
jgi:hypothetical protein